MTPRDWLTLVGSLITLAGVVYQARRAGRSSDRAQKVALKAKQDELVSSANAAENSGYTRAQAMVKEAAEAQQRSFDAAIARQDRQMADMQRQLDAQAQKIAEQQQELSKQHVEIRQLQEARDKDRRTYTRYIQKLLDLLTAHHIDYPTPPPFFDEGE